MASPDATVPRSPRPHPALLAGAGIVVVLLVAAAVLLGRGDALVAPQPTQVARTVTPSATALVGYPGGIASSTGPVPAGFTRYSGTVVNAQGDPIPNVCVYAGPASGCPAPSLVTDASGRWTFDFPSGLVWPFNFEHPLYAAKTGLTGETLDVTLVPKQ